jgi:hypothetical protein
VHAQQLKSAAPTAEQFCSTQCCVARCGRLAHCPPGTAICADNSAATFAARLEWMGTLRVCSILRARDMKLVLLFKKKN